MVFSAVFAVVLNWMPAMGRASGRPNETFDEIPMSIGDWGGERGSFDENTMNALPSCALFTADYVNSRGEMVQLSIVYGRDLGDFHQPEYCLEGQGWKTTHKRALTITEEDGTKHRAVELHQSMAHQDQVVLYWFATEGKAATTLGKHKIKVYLDRLLSRQVRPSALVRFIAPVRSDQSSASAAAHDLATKMGPLIRKMLHP